ncbi:SRPBCC family protein [Sandaracinus amylolyticus]|uniref:SRPBCC family protein n=1 Tax=Sandaracinus amylolyticus TaxID=927083 RepID=UPI001F39817B|nr:SRPBCC family protein [Sandaracinus amylolyticus]UJR78448.1 ATPase [Sandaracinus amylolyticus]
MSETSMELRGDREIIIARTFRAPPRIVFEAYTKPEHVKRWWAPKSLGCEVTSCEADVRVGGRYRFVTRAGGQDFAFSGTYTEVTSPTRLVYTQVFEPMADAGHAVVTVTFEDHEGTTRFVSHELYPSAEAREAALASGMEHGMRETMRQLDELVVSLARDAR